MIRNFCRYAPLETCSVQNCRIKYNTSRLSSADIIVFPLHNIRNVKELQLVTKRKPDQIWAFLIDESPLYLFSSSRKNHLASFNNLFNWSITYRMDADVPIPFGRTTLLKVGETVSFQSYAQWNRNKKQDVLVATVSSNCRGKNGHWGYVKALQKHLEVDVYGKCGNKVCQSDLNTKHSSANDCKEISKYKFYLAFENSNCDEYITEKVWWNGYAKKVIPIVMGGSKEVYDHLLPIYSFLHVGYFVRPRDLVEYLIYLNNTPSDIYEYFKWKRYFKVINDHGYFGTQSVYCRVCEALNYNNKSSKVYDNLSKFWNLPSCQSN